MIRLREAFLVTSCGLVAVLTDRLLVLAGANAAIAGTVDDELVLQSVILTVLLLLLHLYLFLKKIGLLTSTAIGSTRVWMRACGRSRNSLMRMPRFSPLFH